MKKVECYTLGIAQVNTYVVWNERHVLVVDPGSNPATLIRELQMQDANCGRSRINSWTF